MIEAPPTLCGRDGTTLYLHRWPVPEPRAVVLIAHGLGEHGGRHEEAAEVLNRRGLSVVAPDHRGHGRSQGKRTHVRYFHDFLDDLATVEAEACPPDLPLVLWGHSMGGLMVLRYLQSRPTRARAAVVQAPWLGHSPLATALKRWAGKALGVIWPSARLSASIRPEDLTRDVDRQEARAADPLVRSTISPRLFDQATRAWKTARAAPDAIDRPLFFLVPENDVLVDPAGTLVFASRITGAEVRIRRDPEWGHEVHQELDRLQVFREVAAWIEEWIDR